MRKSTKWLLLGGSAETRAALAAAYGMTVRSWLSKWGATREELDAPMPFDELIERPNYLTTRIAEIRHGQDSPATSMNRVSEGTGECFGNALLDAPGCLTYRRSRLGETSSEERE